MEAVGKGLLDPMVAYKGSLFDDPVEDFRLKLGYNVVGLRFGLAVDTGLTRMTVEAGVTL